MLYSPAVLGSYSPFSTPASLEDLLAIPDLRMGCVKGGSTYNFFNNAFLHNRDSVLGRIYAEKLDTLSPQSRLTKTNKEVGKKKSCQRTFAKFPSSPEKAPTTTRAF